MPTLEEMLFVALVIHAAQQETVMVKKCEMGLEIILQAAVQLHGGFANRETVQAVSNAADRFGVKWYVIAQGPESHVRKSEAMSLIDAVAKADELNESEATNNHIPVGSNKAFGLVDSLVDKWVPSVLN